MTDFTSSHGSLFPDEDFPHNNADAVEASLRTVSGQIQDNETLSDEELRPSSLDTFIGQPQLKAQMKLFRDAAQKRGVPPDHIMLAGPPGLGKTTQAI